MLTWIRGGGSDHPLDTKDAKRGLQDDLARMPPVVALDQLASYLDDVKTSHSLRPKQALEIVELLDRAGSTLQRNLTREYVLRRDGLTKFHENRLWTGVSAYCRQLAEGYRFCLAQYQVGAAGASAIKPHLHRITCRALRACAAQLKWMLLRYGPVEQRLWQELGSLYRLSESLQFAQTSSPIYPHSESSPERELLRAAMLAVSSPDALSPLQIEIAEHIIAHVAEKFRMSARPSAGICYVFDLSGEQGPGRFSTSRKLTSDTRCFGPTDIATEIEQSIQFIDQNRALPRSLALGEDFDVSSVHATLRHLLRYWSPALPERREQRRRHVERVRVVHQFDEVAAAVGGLFIESPFLSNDEEWIIENRSQAGFGACVQSPDGAWLKTGTLIAIRRDEGASWSAGIVRRVSVDEKGNHYVGIEMLAQGGTAVTILEASSSARGGAIPARGEICVLLPSFTVDTGEALLLMRAGLFSHSQRLLMCAYDRQYLLSALDLVEQGTEFDLGRYRIIEQLEQSSELLARAG